MTKGLESWEKRDGCARYLAVVARRASNFLGWFVGWGGRGKNGTMYVVGREVPHSSDKVSQGPAGRDRVRKRKKQT